VSEEGAGWAGAGRFLIVGEGGIDGRGHVFGVVISSHLHIELGDDAQLAARRLLQEVEMNEGVVTVGVAAKDADHLHGDASRAQAAAGPQATALGQGGAHQRGVTTATPSGGLGRAGADDLLQISSGQATEGDHIQTGVAVVDHDLDRHHLLNPGQVGDALLVVLWQTAGEGAEAVLAVDDQAAIVAGVGRLAQAVLQGFYAGEQE
jgi:hypothetical protein